MLGQQHLHGAAGLELLGGAGLARARQGLAQAAVGQKATLRGVAQHLPARLLTGQGDAGEVDVAGDVFIAHFDQRVGVALVQVVAHQRAAGALRVVVLALGEAVVQEEGRAARHALGQRGHKGLGLAVGFGDGAGHVLAVGALGGRAHAFGGGAVQPDEAGRGVRSVGRRRIGRGLGGGFGAGQAHATLQPTLAIPAHQVHGHGVQHLVAHDHAFQRIGQAVGPHHLVHQARVLFLQTLVLAVAQRARQVDDGVARDALAQLAQQLLGQGAGARAKLPDLVRAGGVQRLAQLGGHDLAKERRQFGGGHEVAAVLRTGTDHPATTAVVAQSRGVQGQFHEAFKAHPAATFADFVRNQVGQRVAVQGGGHYTVVRCRRAVHAPL